MIKKSYHVAVIGAGAAGMTAAIAALEEAAEQRERAQRKEAIFCRDVILQEGQKKNTADVLLLESNERVGKKILATGNGKCNFTHRDVSAEHYHTDCRAVLEAVLSEYPTQAVLDFFEGLGMLSREKNGYFYPLPETASTVLDVLRLRLSELGCEISCGVYIERIERTAGGFVLGLREAERRYQVYADRVILATGSEAGGFLQNKKEDPLRPARLLGLHSTLLYPALTKCICREEHYYRQLAGVRAQVELKLFCDRECSGDMSENNSRYPKGNLSDRRESGRENGDGSLKLSRQKAGKPELLRGEVRASAFSHGEMVGQELLRREAGELQLTKEGISGIAVFQLSGEIAQRLAEGKRVTVEINFLPDFSEDQLKEWAERRLALLPGRTLEEFLLGVLHKKVLGVCLQAEGLKGGTRIPADDKGPADLDRKNNSGKLSSKQGKGVQPSAGERAVKTVCSVMKRAMHFTTEVTAVSDMRQAQVCRGGLRLAQFDEKLECRTIPGLFACGEVLNVDGECGGYNLHFAWASGLLAGKWAMQRAAFDR